MMAKKPWRSRPATTTSSLTLSNLNNFAAEASAHAERLSAKVQEPKD
jgi:hypothetical protein